MRVDGGVLAFATETAEALRLVRVTAQSAVEAWFRECPRDDSSPGSQLPRPDVAAELLVATSAPVESSAPGSSAGAARFEPPSIFAPPVLAPPLLEAPGLGGPGPGAVGVPSGAPSPTGSPDRNETSTTSRPVGSEHLTELRATASALRGHLVDVDAAMLASEGFDWGLTALAEGFDAALQGLPVAATLSTRTETTDQTVLGAQGPEESATVPLREWFGSGWRDETRTRAEELRITLNESRALARSEVAQALRVLEYHVLSAEHAIEDEGDDDAEELIAAGIDRTRELFDAARSSASNRAERALRSFVADVSAITSRFCSPIVGHRPQEVLETLADPKPSAPARPTHLRTLATGLVQRAAPILDAFLRDTREVVSGRRHSEHVDRSTALLAVELSDATRGLPAAYRRLFSPNPTELADVYVGRPDLEDECSRSLDSWRRGRPETMWLIGERGAGRRTLISRWLSTARKDEGLAWVRLDTETRDEAAMARQLAEGLELPAAQRLQDVEQSLHAAPGRRIAVVDALERVFTPDRAGIARVDALLDFMTRTSRHALWVTLVSKTTSDFLLRDGLLRVLPTSTCVVAPMDHGRIRALVELRHALSGMSLEFAPAPTQRLRVASARPLSTLLASAARRSTATDVYFERLSEISLGNPQHAMACWLLSAHRSERDTATLIISPLPEALPDFTAKLRPAECHALAAIARAESLRGSEVAAYLNLDPESTESLLSTLEARGLVARTPKRPESLSLPRLRAPAIVHELRQRGLL